MGSALGSTFKSRNFFTLKYTQNKEKTTEIRRFQPFSWRRRRDSNSKFDGYMSRISSILRYFRLFPQLLLPILRYVLMLYQASWGQNWGQTKRLGAMLQALCFARLRLLDIERTPTISRRPRKQPGGNGMPPVGIIAHNSRRHKCYTATTYFNPRIFRFHVSSLYFTYFKIF